MTRRREEHPQPKPDPIVVDRLVVLVDDPIALELPIVRERRARGQIVTVVDVRETDDRGRARWHSRIEWRNADPDQDPDQACRLCACGRKDLISTVEQSRGRCDWCILANTIREAQAARSAERGTR